VNILCRKKHFMLDYAENDVTILNCQFTFKIYELCEGTIKLAQLLKFTSQLTNI